MDKDLEAEAYWNRSRVSSTSYQFDQSILFCKRALTIKPNHYNAHFRWGSDLTGKGLYEKSVIKHHEVVCRNPKDHVGYNNLGLALEWQNKLFEAEIQYKKSLEIDPSYQISLHNMAVVLTKQRKYSEALQQFEKIIVAEDEESLASAYSSYGYLKFLLGKPEEAIESFEKAIDKDSNLSLPYFNKALVLYCLGKQELFAEMFKKAFERFASSQGWRTRLQRTISIYTGELNSSIELLEDADFKEIKKEQLIINIKGFEFILDLLKKELTKPLDSGFSMK